MAKGRKNLLVGITGGIGAGKSALASVYKEKGFPVFSADEIAREIVAPGQPALAEVASLFGEGSLLADGRLDRAFVRARIVKDPALRLKLEAITHPRIQERAQALAAEAFALGASLVFYEAPLLFEAKSERVMDKVICVHAPEDLRLERIMARDHCDRAHAAALLASQMPQQEKMDRSDFLVENRGDRAELHARAEELLERIEKAGKGQAKR